MLAGEAFGPSAAGHLRLGLVLDADQLQEACRRIALCALEVLEERPALTGTGHC
ncbi:Arginine--pyruvate transaminase AruH [compost metagenome]